MVGRGDAATGTRPPGQLPQSGWAPPAWSVRPGPAPRHHPQERHPDPAASGAGAARDLQRVRRRERQRRPIRAIKPGTGSAAIGSSPGPQAGRRGRGGGRAEGARGHQGPPPAREAHAATRPAEVAHGDFFIKRPIVAIVISIVIVLLGLTACAACPSSSTRPRASHHPRHRHLPRRLRGRGRAVRGHAHRAAGQRRREHDLHEVAQHERRPHAVDVKFEVGMNQDMANVLVQNRVSRPSATAPGSDPAGRHGQEATPAS